MLRVGLTGGIGSGKSTVAAMLRGLGAVVTDADAVAREVVEPGMPALAAIREHFGPHVIRADGGLDRAGLAAVVFPDPAALRALEAITGPAIAARVAALRAAVPADRIDAYDMPLLVEQGLWVHEHLSVVVGAPEQVRLERLVAQRGLAEADARARIARQATDAQRHEVADVWIDNGATSAATEAQVRELWERRLAPFDANLRHGIRARRPAAPTLSEPDPGWGAAGARVVARIAAALAGRGAEVEHIGSTSVPGLPAKDVVDVQVTVHRLAAADDPRFVAALRRAGYVLVPRNRRDHPHPADSAPGEWSKRFYGGCDPQRIVHLHVRETGSAGARFAVVFRDWLRAEPAARQEYAALKARLAASTATTRGYSEAKEPWFAAAYDRAMAWAGDAHR